MLRVFHCSLNIYHRYLSDVLVVPRNRISVGFSCMFELDILDLVFNMIASSQLGDSEYAYLSHKQFVFHWINVHKNNIQCIIHKLALSNKSWLVYNRNFVALYFIYYNTILAEISMFILCHLLICLKFCAKYYHINFDHIQSNGNKTGLNSYWNLPSYQGTK